MKKFVKTSVFITVISLLLVAVIGFGSWAVVLTVQNNKLEKRLNSALSKIEDTNKLCEEIKSENEVIESENAQLKKHNIDLEYKLNASKNEIKNINKLLNKVGTKSLIEAEKALAAETSPQAKVIPNDKVCYLTFDDGPSDRTLEILEILDRYDALATFFVVGNAKLEYLPYIVEKGHTVGLHSNTHNYASIYKNTDAFFNDLNALSDKVYDITGIHSRVIRFPGGGSNVVSKKYCKGVMTRLTSQVHIKGYAYFDWNIDSTDASGKNVPTENIINSVLTAAQGKSSICVLMHDTSSKTTTVEALPEILKGLSAMGYRFEALDETVYGFHHNVKN